MNNRMRVVPVGRADWFDIERVIVELIDEGGIFKQAPPPSMNDLDGCSGPADDLAVMATDKLADDYVSGTRPNIGFRHVTRRLVAMLS